MLLPRRATAQINRGAAAQTSNPVHIQTTGQRIQSQEGATDQRETETDLTLKPSPEHENLQLIDCTRQKKNMWLRYELTAARILLIPNPTKMARTKRECCRPNEEGVPLPDQRGSPTPKRIRRHQTTQEIKAPSQTEPYHQKMTVSNNQTTGSRTTEGPRTGPLKEIPSQRELRTNKGSGKPLNGL